MSNRTAPPIPIEDFFRKPARAMPLISPEGTWLAWLEPWERRLNVVVRNIASGETRRVTSATERDVGGFAWVSDERLVYVQDSGGDENHRLYVVGADGGNPLDLTPFEGVKCGILDDLEDNPDEILIQMNRRDPQVFDVFRLNVHDGSMVEVAQNPGNVQSWITDHDGNLRVATTTDGVATGILYRPTEADEWREVATYDFKESVQPLVFTMDNQALYVSSNVGRDRSAIFEWDPVTGKELRLVFEHDVVDVAHVLYSKARRVLTGVRLRRPTGCTTSSSTSSAAGCRSSWTRSSPATRTGSSRCRGTRRPLRRLLRERPQPWGATTCSTRRADGADPAVRDLAVARRAADGADGADRAGEPRRSDPAGVSRRARGGRGEEPAAGRASPRWAVASGFLGVRPRGPVPGQPGLRGPRGQLPRVDRLRPQVLGGRLRPVGPGDAGRHHRRRPLGGRPGDRRPGARRDLRRELRRLCDLGRPDQDSRPLRLRDQLRRRFQPVHLDQGDPAVLEASTSRCCTRWSATPSGRGSAFEETSPFFNADRIRGGAAARGPGRQRPASIDRFSIT